MKSKREINFNIAKNGGYLIVVKFFEHVGDQGSHANDASKYDPV